MGLGQSPLGPLGQIPLRRRPGGWPLSEHLKPSGYENRAGYREENEEDEDEENDRDDEMDDADKEDEEEEDDEEDDEEEERETGWALNS